MTKMEVSLRFFCQQIISPYLPVALKMATNDVVGLTHLHLALQIVSFVQNKLLYIFLIGMFYFKQPLIFT